MASRSERAVLERPKLAFLSDKGTDGKKVATMVVSDIHLGSKVSRVKRLMEIIENEYQKDGKYLFDQLVLLGDIFDTLELKRLTNDDWNFLLLIQKISEPEYGVRVVWMNGNHDERSETVVEDFFDTKVLRDYTWIHGGKRFIATHGDRFDKFIKKNERIANFFSTVYIYVQSLDFKTRPISRFFKRLSKKIYLPKTIYLDMMAYARGKKADVIFCGHTHHADSAVAPDGIAYFNTGCWTDIPSTYVTVGLDGAIKTHEVW
jgi:UDP-2,3-diacylglucosamine pyrophosphatase LpxH